MTWNRLTHSPINVMAHTTRLPSGEDGVMVRVGNESAFLSQEDAASLGGYLMGVTNNAPKAGDPR